MRSSALAVLYPGAVSFEIMLAIELLGSVDVVTSNDADHCDASGLTIRPSVSFEAAQAVPYTTVLIPGGNPDSIAGDTRIKALLEGARARQGTLAGICAGVVVLADAGLLTGRQITHNYGPDAAPPEVVAATEHLWAGVSVIDQPCVIDEETDGATVVTAHPSAYIDFAVTVAHLAGRFDSEGADRRARYYRGLR